MPRIRTIKPEFWTSEQVVECSVTARLLFIGMWNFADDRGVLPASLKRLKMEIFPADGFTIQYIGELVRELVDAKDSAGVGLIGEFKAENRMFWYITGWHHQRIDRPSPRYPAPPCDGSNSTSTQRGLTEGSPPDTETETDGKRKRTGNGTGTVREVTSVRSVVRSKVTKVDWKKTFGIVRAILKIIHEKWDWIDKEGGPNNIWVATPVFLDKLAKAAACVQIGVLPEGWLLDAIDQMLDAKKDNPDRWLGKVLAATAKEKYGVDFDAYQRAITVPKKGDDA